MLQSLIAALVLAAVHVFAVKLRPLGCIPRSRWLSAAGGIAVAYVFIHLLPELAHGQRVIEESELDWLTYLEEHAYLLALAGLLAFYGLEQLIKVHKRHLSDPTESHADIFWLHIGSFAVYNGLIGYLLVKGWEAGVNTLIWYTIAMGLHFLVNDFGLQSDHRRLFGNAGRWILAVAPLAGWTLGMLTEISELALSALTAVIAGGVILNVLKEELPEERESRFSAFLLGALGYSALLLVSGGI